MRFFSRFSIRTLLLATLFVGLIMWVLGPTSSKIEMGPIKTLMRGQAVIAEFSVKNNSLIPFWYLWVESDSEYLVELKTSTGKLYSAGSRYSNWKKLSFCEKIRVERHWVSNGDRLGIRFKDCFGRESIVWHPEIVRLDGDFVTMDFR